MRVFVSAITFDLQGYAMLEPLPDSDYGVLLRRANRVRTLDGGVAVNDFGFTHADREFLLNLRPSKATDTTLRYLVENYGQVHVSTDDGFFTAIPQYVVIDGVATLTLSITEQLA